ncbi:MAG: PKD domain-containing protein, partial [Candidatus Thermoplasmatota archaeon]|nr:PKD domain-containing protein [Candidatus Thermoplasmatota archaeon]
SISEPGEYYFVAKAQVDQVYGDVLDSGEYGDDPYLRLIKERTNDSYYESLVGSDGLEEIIGQTWWYSPVIHVTVGNMQPTAQYTWSDADGSSPGTMIDFDASSSTAENITLYEWDWTNDGIYDYSSTQPTASFDYGDANSYECTLQITDNLSQTDTITKTVQANVVTDVEQTAFDRGFPIRHAVDGDWAGAQNFTPTMNSITKVELYLRSFGTPEFDLTVEIRENDPEGTLLDTQTFTPSEVSSSWSWFTVDFTDITVDSGTDYFIVVPPAPSGVTSSFGYEWGYAFGNQYDDGSFWFTRDGGSLWRDLPTMYEFTFKTYGIN